MRNFMMFGVGLFCTALGLFIILVLLAVFVQLYSEYEPAMAPEQVNIKITVPEPEPAIEVPVKIPPLVPHGSTVIIQDGNVVQLP